MIDRINRDYPGLFLPVCVVSVPEEAKLFEDHGVETYVYPNNPVSNKHNFILSKLAGRVSHVLYLGSDDIIDNNYINEMLKHKSKDLVWGIGLYFYEARSARVRFWDMPYRRVAGPAKLMAAKLLDKCDWHIWNDGIDHGLDHSCYRIMEPHIETKHIFRIKDVNGLMVDIKSEMNINPFSNFVRSGIPASAEAIYKRLSEHEVEYLHKLRE